MLFAKQVFGCPGRGSLPRDRLRPLRINPRGQRVGIALIDQASWDIHKVSIPQPIRPVGKGQLHRLDHHMRRPGRIAQELLAEIEIVENVQHLRHMHPA